MGFIHLNDRLVPAQEALVSVNERGFRFGDGLFETIPVYGGMPYLWDYHMERLRDGLIALRITYPTGDLLKQSLELLKANATQEGLLRISISRGIGSYGYLPRATAMPLLVIQHMNFPAALDESVKIWLSSFEKISSLALPAECKHGQGLNSTLARMEASENHCHEALQLNARSQICESSSANIFWFKDHTLYTPSPECGMVHGVTRRRVLELSPYKVIQGEFTLGALQNASAVILTNASRGAIAVASLEPHGHHWDSEELAKEINILRQEDIRTQCAQMRELTIDIH